MISQLNLVVNAEDLRQQLLDSMENYNSEDIRQMILHTLRYPKIKMIKAFDTLGVKLVKEFKRVLFFCYETGEDILYKIRVYIDLKNSKYYLNAEGERFLYAEGPPGDREIPETFEILEEWEISFDQDLEDALDKFLCDLTSKHKGSFEP